MEAPLAQRGARRVPGHDARAVVRGVEVNLSIDQGLGGEEVAVQVQVDERDQARAKGLRQRAQLVVVQVQVDEAIHAVAEGGRQSLELASSPHLKQLRPLSCSY